MPSVYAQPMLTQYASSYTPPEELPIGWTSHKCDASGKTMFMHSFTNRVTLDREEVFGGTFLDSEKKCAAINSVTPNTYGTSSDDEGEDGDVEDSTTQVHTEDQTEDEFTTPKKRKASEVSTSIELVDSDSDSD